MKLNLEKIAKLSGVSRSTVSRVINNDPNVKSSTRERVLTIVRQSNFHPNAAARSLAAGRTRVLGLVIPQGVSTLFAEPYFSLVIQGVSTACNSLDHSVMLWLAEPEFERRTINQIIAGGMIDGIIISSAVKNDPVISALAQSDVPFILIGRQVDQPNVSYVDVDNFSGAHEVVTHLLCQGYRRVAAITGPLNTIAATDRRDGYLEALKDRQVAFDPALVVEGDFTEGSGYAAVQRLLPYNPEAIFAASDIMAIGALRALREAGLRVPDDVALVGYDDIPIAAHMEPPLTTMRQPIYRLGITAAETLIDMVGHTAAHPRRMVLPTELVIRESCGANRGGNKNSQPLKTGQTQKGGGYRAEHPLTTFTLSSA